MCRQVRNLHKTRRTSDAFRRILAIAVLALFIAVCLGQLLAPQIVFFGELVPVVSGSFIVVVRYYFVGRGQA
jgi:hypothetical protein